MYAGNVCSALYLFSNKVAFVTSFRRPVFCRFLCSRAKIDDSIRISNKHKVW